MLDRLLDEVDERVPVGVSRGGLRHPQFDYVVDAVTSLHDRALAYVDVDQSAHDAFQAEIDRRNGQTVWASGCSSWYLADGHNLTLWPGYTFEYRRRTRRFDTEHYHEVARDELPAGDRAASVV